MSKSLGNFFTLRDVFAKFDPMVVRYYYLNHYYRAPLDFSFDDLSAVQKSYQRLCKAFESVVVGNVENAAMQESPVVQRMLAFLLDDLNTPGMFGVLFEALPQLQKDAHQAMLVKAFIQRVLGLTLVPLPEKEIEITSEMERLIAEREAARTAKDWARADALRDQLKQLGYEVQDKKKA
jgi:cysteinyl-tRNA synthetase